MEKQQAALAGAVGATGGLLNVSMAGLSGLHANGLLPPGAAAACDALALRLPTLRGGCEQDDYLTLEWLQPSGWAPVPMEWYFKDTLDIDGLLASLEWLLFVVGGIARWPWGCGILIHFVFVCFTSVFCFGLLAVLSCVYQKISSSSNHKFPTSFIILTC